MRVSPAALLGFFVGQFSWEAITAADNSRSSNNLRKENVGSSRRVYQEQLPVPKVKNQLIQEKLEKDKTSIVAKIVNGIEVDPPHTKYPYIVFLGGCGGSLVAPNVVLTAAHCENYTNRVHIGRHNLFDAYESFESFNILEKVTHPGYNVASSFDNDFMLVRFDGKSSRRPVILDDGDILLNSGLDAIIMGWGLTSNGGTFSNILLEAEVDVYTESECYSKYYSYITESMFCAARDGRDSCQGDSGGPIIDKVTGKQIGVVSWGIGCADPEYPGVYAKVQNQIGWINSYIDAWKDNSPTATATPTSPITPAPASPTPAPTPATCENYSFWVDQYGQTCEFYEKNMPKGCEHYVGCCDAGFGTPDQACCHCGGGSSLNTHSITPTASTPASDFVLFADGQGGGICENGKAVSEEDCLQAALEVGVGMSLKDFLNVGSWDFTPCGCFIYDDSWVDYKDPSHGNCLPDNKSNLICRVEEAVTTTAPTVSPTASTPTSDFVLFADGQGGGICENGKAVSEEDCLQAALEVGIGMSLKDFLNVGSWDFTPCGCFIYADSWVDYKDPSHGNCLPDNKSNLVCRG